MTSANRKKEWLWRIAIAVLAFVAAVLASRAQERPLVTKRVRLSSAQEASITGARAQIEGSRQYLHDLQRQVAVDMGLGPSTMVRVGDHYAEVITGFSYDNDPENMWTGDCSSCDDDANYQPEQ